VDGKDGKDGKIYALGATGRLNCLDAVTGAVVWSHDVLADAGAKMPMWGFSSSPLVYKGLVTVFASGPSGKSVLAYHTSGGQAWAAGDGEWSYCSPQLAKLDGVEQVLITNEHGLVSFDPTSGKVLWKYDFEGQAPPRVAQPAILNETDVLFGCGQDPGAHRLRVRRDGAGWKTEVVWTSNAIKPYFNDLVIHGDHIYGFDGAYLTCVGLQDGKKKWRARGYGNGQVLLLADQGLLVVLTEDGMVALVEAKPAECHELGRFDPFPDADPRTERKTWNHPVVAHGRLYVRNAAWMACYELTPAK
jgi:outer membrane protein assembly factor BamB